MFNKNKISILVENWVCDIWLKGEWWLSMFIEFDWKKILWDTWWTEIFLENAQTMNINIDESDLIVLSHFHSDHVGWIKSTNFANNRKILTHPRVFDEIWSEIQWKYAKIESKWVYDITSKIFFLWEIERTSIFEEGVYWKDTMLDDTAMVLNTKKGLFIIAWCSHSWIVNICEYAKKVTWKNKIYWLVWGLHLLKMVWEDMSSDLQIEQTLNYFEKEKIERLYPIHCVDFEVLSEMQKRFNIKKLYAWDVIEF